MNILADMLTPQPLTFQKTNHQIAEAADRNRRAVRASMEARKAKLGEAILNEQGDFTLERVLDLVQSRYRSCASNRPIHPVLVMAMGCDMERRIAEKLDFIHEHLGGEQEERVLILDENTTKSLFLEYDPSAIDSALEPQMPVQMVRDYGPGYIENMPIGGYPKVGDTLAAAIEQLDLGHALGRII
jgi:hypothetical protein